ncbi:TonB-dependent receptor [Burkholderia pyrrocinia]|uniref:TonB-dependent receptor n=1 Tax=Burkholderia pyrrocinia TaxID=60550 RepID=UPI002AB15A46|nr:TonB-dependent receptor [Burkholderia pyrrocinia]
MKALAVEIGSVMQRFSRIHGPAMILAGLGLSMEPLMSMPASAADLSQAQTSSGTSAVEGKSAVSSEKSPQQAESARTTTGKQEKAGEAGTQALGTVVVSARKKLERAQDVPVSITAVGADTLLQKNDVSIKDFFKDVPGLNFSGGDRGSSEVSLRGITTGVGGNPTTAITIDDTPFGMTLSSAGGGSNLPDLDPSDLARIEVLRGPQGTLYGASSLGGLIKYVTVAPNTYNFSGRVEVDGSSADGGGLGYGARAAVNIPIANDLLGLRISVFDRRDPGFVADTRQGTTNVDAVRTRGGRISALWTPTDSITVRSSALFQNSWADGSSTVDTVNGVPLFGPYAHQRIPGTDGFNRTIGFYDISIVDDFKWAKLTSTTSYGHISYVSPQDGTDSLQPFFGAAFPTLNLGAVVNNWTNSNKFTQELRLDSPEGNRKIDWRVGLFFTQEKADLNQRITAVDPLTGNPVAGVPVVASAFTNTTYKELSSFGTVTYHFTDRFDIQAGGRLSKNWEDFGQNSGGLIIGPQSTMNGTSSTQSATYLVTPRFRFSQDLMAYATVSTGYRPGGPNVGVSSASPATYGPDRTTNYELGIKGDLFDRKLSFAAALYYIDWKNIQILGVDQNGISFFENGNAAKSAGFEASFVWNPMYGLTISGNAVYSDSALTDDLPANSVDVGASGSRLPFSSKVTASLSANQEFPIDIGQSGVKGYVGGTLSFVGDRLGNFQAAGVERDKLPGFATVDLQGGVHTKTWSVGLFAKNLFNKYGYVGAFQAGAVTQFQLLTPRTIGVSLSHTL